MVDIKTLSVPDFASHLEESFAVEVGGDTLGLTLVEVKDLGQGEREGGAFSTLWLGPQSPVLSQGTYILRHSKLGALALFLVPVAQKGAGIQYEAIFT